MIKTRSRISRGARQRAAKVRAFLLPCLALSAPIYAPLAMAGPTGGNVVAGSAEIRSNGRQTDVIQSTNRAVIDWRGFSVDAGESVFFRQPSAQSATLNRVTGDQVSRILGTIGANGQIILLNPNGVLFGQGARVDVGSLITSTSNLSTDNFMAGRLTFTATDKPGGSIVNRGTITAAEGGLIALVAPHVRNDGLLYARLGRVTIGSGSSFTIDLNGDGLVNLAIRESDLQALKDVEGNPVTARIEHTGSTAADGGRIIVLAAHDAANLVNDVINLNGVVRADSVGLNGRGSIVLGASNGRINVGGELLALGTDAGQAGGTISVFGADVHLTDAARLNASGQAGGGTISIQSDAAIAGSRVVVDREAQLNASAQTQGRGGLISLSGDQVDLAGTLIARGGGSAGDGGRIEIEARAVTLNGGAGDASATAGAAGTFVARQLQGDMRIGEQAATSINRSLRTGTNVELNVAGLARVESRIDGRGDKSKGGLKIEAGEVQIAHDVYTNDGRIELHAADTHVQMLLPASGTLDGSRAKPVLFAGAGDIVIDANKNAVAYHLITSGNVSVTSRNGNVELKERLGYDLGGTYKPASVTVRALGTPASDAEVLQVGNVNHLRDIAVAAGGSIDIHATRNIRLAEGPVTASNTRTGLVAARDGVGGRSLRMQSDRLGASTVGGTERLGDLTRDTFYWTGTNSRIGYAGPDKNPNRTDGRFVDLSALKERDLNNPTITSPSPISVLANNAAVAQIAEVRPGAGPADPGSVAVPPVIAASDPSPVPTTEPTPVASAEPAAIAPPGPPQSTVTADAGATVAQAGESISATTLKQAQRAGVDAAEESNRSADDEQSDGEVDPNYSGGRGVAQSADTGRGRTTSAASDVFRSKEHVVELRNCANLVVAGNAYLTRSVFGQPLMRGCQ